MNGFVDQFLHVRGQVAAEAQLVARYGMDEAKHRRVQCLTLKIQTLEQLAMLGPASHRWVIIAWLGDGAPGA